MSVIMYWKAKFMLLCIVICAITCYDTYSNDEEDMNYYLGRLYEESDDGIDPHDMLTTPSQKKDSSKMKKMPSTRHWTTNWDKERNNDDTGSCTSDKVALSEEQAKLYRCQEENIKLQQSVEVKQKQLSALEKTVMREGSVDMQAFYKRAVQHVWASLQLQEAEKILKDGDSALVRQLVAHITKDDIKTLKLYLESQSNIHQVDDFLSNALVLERAPPVESRNVIALFLEWATSAFEVGKNVEVWLYFLCVSFLLLAIWAVFLFIRDIQQELRWMRVIGMMVVIIFFICCLWHWRHMHKVAESRRHAQMAKRGFTNIPEECKPGGRSTTGNVWDWVKVSVFGAPDVCEQYFEELMVDPTQEITPGMVIAETLSKFFFQPLQHLGSESAKFVSNFYSKVPVVYHFSATIFFLLILVIILFAMCGYGIDFPLWMGGIRPIYRTETTDTSEFDRMRKEMKRDTEMLLSEARMMLTDMVRASASTQIVSNSVPERVHLSLS
ncbi:chloride channel CLIC-like protein 1 isoform X2 [Penaeus japonicus]|uniref:chloride channel CLIC-like protein 1 isoform X2 n=1 Tax=Penaeus japonicus TaxID=27405 RepID=UPI001C712537|nr:chloride channel CLIC-like protein 1 isoform X2 [Penaeus japonicus]